MGVSFFVDPDMLTDPSYPRSALDYAVLYDVSGARENGVPDRCRSGASTAGGFRKLTSRAENNERSARRRQSITIIWSTRARGRSSGRAARARSRSAPSSTCTMRAPG